MTGICSEDSHFRFAEYQLGGREDGSMSCFEINCAIMIDLAYMISH